jgi:hypothetical protein
MSPSAQLILKQLKEMIENETKTGQDARGIQEHVDAEEHLDPDTTSSVLNTILNTINNEFEHKYLDEAVRLLNAHLISQSTDSRVPGHKYSVPGLPKTTFLAHQVCAIWIIVRRWGWYVDVPGALVVDEMGLGTTFSLVAAAMLCILVTEQVVMGLPLSILWGNTLDQWVNDLAQNDFPRMISDEWEWYPLQRLKSVPHCLFEIQSTPPQRHPVLTPGYEPILVVTMPGLAEKFKNVIDKMTYGINFQLINLLHAENANLIYKDLNTSIDKPENQWIIHFVSYDTFTSREKPSINSQHSYCSWSFGIFDEFHWYRTKNSVGWQIAINARFGFNLQVTAMPGFHSLYDWCFQTMWLFSGAPEDQADETVMEKHSAKAQSSGVMSLMHAIRTEDRDTQHDAAQHMIPIAKPRTIRRWSESKLANGKPLVRISKENAHLVDLEWIPDEQAIL